MASEASGRPTLPRDTAIQLIHKVLGARGQYDPLFDAAAATLEPLPTAWLREVTLGTLRWKGRAEHILARYATAAAPKGRTLAALALAVYQVLETDAPPEAVTSETVEWFKNKEGEPTAKFANAVLRRFVADAPKWKDGALAPAPHEPGADVWSGLPPWIWAKLERAHGRKWAMAFAAASLERPRFWARARRPGWTASWGRSGPVPGSWVTEKPGAVETLPGFAEGEFLVQDVSNQILIHEVCGLAKPAAGATALDVCAAPGGKSVGLAWNGYAVTALEKNERRRRRLQENVSRLAPERASVSDLEPFEKGTGTYDLVWLDPPCTGTGVLRRNPEIRWIRTEDDLKSLREIQRELIPKAWERVKPGGHLVYSVCSVLPEEGEEAWDWASLPGAREVRRWLLAPHEAPYGDGFFAVMLVRGA